MTTLDYRITFGQGAEVTGEALSARAKEIFGEGVVEVDITPQEFMKHFPPEWMLVVLDLNTGLGYIMKSKNTSS